MNQTRKIAAYLIVQNLPNIKEPIPVYFGENSFGRNPLKADVCLPDASISEKHAKIAIDQQKITLTDIGSKNGTFLNNQQIKLQKNLSCSIEQNQIIFFAELKCHFVKVKLNKSKQELSDTEFEEQEQKKIEFQKKLQKQKKTKNLDPKKKKQQKKRSPLKIQQNQPTKQLTKNQEKLKGVNKINKNKQQKEKNIDKKIQNQDKTHSEQKVISKQTKNIKKIIQEKAIQNNSSKQEQEKIVNQSKNIKPKNSREKKQTKDKLPEKNEKLPKSIKQVSQHEDGTKLKSKNQQPKQSRKRVPSQQAVYERVSITRKRFNICTKFMISGFSLTFLPHQQLKLIENYQQDFDILVMQKYSRTFKLLYSISKGIPIVTKDWLLQSEYYRKAMPFEHYLLCIPQDKLLIKKSIEKVNEGFRLLTNSKVYLVCPHEKYHLKVSEIQKLIYSMDGQVIQAISAVKDQKTKNLMKNAFIILSRQFSKEDLQKARELNKDNIYTIQLILQGCLRQSLDLKSHKIQ